MPNFGKMGTEQLRTMILKGKLEGEDLLNAKVTLAKRDMKAKPTVPVKKAEKEKPAKKVKAEKVVKEKVVKEKKEKAPKIPKEKKERTLDDFSTEGVSGLVRKMITPKDGTKEAACSYSQASKAVQEKFNRKLHPSEFSRNFDVLKNLGIVETKKAPRQSALVQK